MSKQASLVNEFVSLTVMLLMIIALVAAQADATPSVVADADTLVDAVTAPEQPVPARFRANVELDSMIITIDASADVRRLIPKN